MLFLFIQYILKKPVMNKIGIAIAIIQRNSLWNRKIFV